jgi:hypothetical protein
MKRLNVVVPYRAREQHLAIFVQMVRAYFARDKLDREIPYRVLIVEQENGLPFNRGALKNIGFVLGREASDYTCFHDVDYIPVWADYSWSDAPVGIVWHGAENRPIRVNRPDRGVRHDLANFYGGAALTPNDLFAQVNGYTGSRRRALRWAAARGRSSRSTTTARRSRSTARRARPRGSTSSR